MCDRGRDLTSQSVSRLAAAHLEEAEAVVDARHDDDTRD